MQPVAPVPAAVSETSPTVLVCGVCGERFQASVDSGGEPADEIPVVRPLARPVRGRAKNPLPNIEEPVAEAVAEEEPIVMKAVCAGRNRLCVSRKGSDMCRKPTPSKAEVSEASGWPRSAMKPVTPDNGFARDTDRLVAQVQVSARGVLRFWP